MALFSFDHNIGKPYAKKESNFFFFFFFFLLYRAEYLNSSFVPAGRTCGICTPQTLPTSASRNIRKTVRRIHIWILELKSWETCLFPRVFSNNLATIVVLVAVNEGITYISLFLELEEEADFSDNNGCALSVACNGRCSGELIETSIA